MQIWHSETKFEVFRKFLSFIRKRLFFLLYVFEPCLYLCVLHKILFQIIRFRWGAEWVAASVHSWLICLTLAIPESVRFYLSISDITLMPQSFGYKISTFHCKLGIFSVELFAWSVSRLYGKYNFVQSAQYNGCSIMYVF